MYRQLRKEHVFRNEYNNNEIDTVLLGFEYTFKKNDTVFIYRYDTSCFLYDFSAKAGDIWKIPGNLVVCDSFGFVKVDYVNKTSINDKQLRTIRVSPLINSHWQYSWDNSGLIIEDIGCIDYFFPNPNMNCGYLDIGEGDYLRCYSDSIMEYSTDIVSNCDYILLDVNESGENLSIYMNFTEELLVIDIFKPLFINDIDVLIYDVNGSVILNKNFKYYNSRIEIPINIKKGLYIVKLLSTKTLIYSSKILKNY